MKFVKVIAVHDGCPVVDAESLEASDLKNTPWRELSSPCNCGSSQSLVCIVRGDYRKECADCGLITMYSGKVWGSRPEEVGNEWTDVRIKEVFLSGEIFKSFLNDFSCCGNAQKNGAIFSMLVSGDDLKCICTSCYRSYAFHIPFIMGGHKKALGEDFVQRS